MAIEKEKAAEIRHWKDANATYQKENALKLDLSGQDDWSWAPSDDEMAPLFRAWTGDRPRRTGRYFDFKKLCVEHKIDPDYFDRNLTGIGAGAVWKSRLDDAGTPTISIRWVDDEKDDIDHEDSRSDGTETRKLFSAFVLALIAGGIAGVGALTALHSPTVGLGAGSAVAIVAYLYLSR